MGTDFHLKIILSTGFAQFDVKQKKKKNNYQIIGKDAWTESRWEKIKKHKSEYSVFD